MPIITLRSSAAPTALELSICQSVMILVTHPSAPCFISLKAISANKKRKYHHWYLNRALKITPEDEAELGPPGQKRSRRGTLDGIDKTRIVDDPGVGAAATANGGGWMGAVNDRL